MAHGVYVDAQDFVWTIDEGTNTVIKWNPNTARPEMILGRRYESLEGLGPAIAPMPPPDPYAFNRPSDVVPTPKAISSSQTAITTAARSSTTRTEGSSRPRSARAGASRARCTCRIRSRPTEPETSTLEIGTTAASGLHQRSDVEDDVRELARYAWAVCVSQGPHQYLYVSNSNPDQNVAAVNAVTGEIFKMELDGTVVGKFGKAGKGLGELSTVHDLDCRNENEILVGEIVAWRAQKFTLFKYTRAPPRTANTK